jgi:hypothetical protein
MHRALRARPLRIVCGLIAALALAAPVSASSTAGFKATFTEAFGGPNHSPFSCPPGDSCGSGNVVGLGQVTEVIVFGGPGGPGFDVRTITFADGSALVLDETGSHPSIPGASYYSSSSYGNPFHLDLTDVVDGAASSGAFAGAAGILTGTVNLAGGMAIISLSGAITVP